MAATLANELFIKNQIDYVVCFAHSLAVLESMRSTFSTTLNRPMHGQLGAAGGVFSYQYLASSKSADWSFLKNNRVLVIFDEIQRAPELLSYLQVLVDEQKKVGQFILTGSHQLRLQKAVSQSLAGRTAVLKLLPLSLREIKQSNKEQSLDQQLLKGGYPRLYE